MVGEGAASAPQFAVRTEQLVAMVRTNEFEDVISRPLTGHLSLVVAADVGEAFIYPTAEKLRDAGLSPSEAIDASVSNVDRVVGQINTNLVGDPVYLPAASNVLLVASASDSGTLAAMRHMARDNCEPHRITDKVVKCKAGWTFDSQI